MNNIELEAARRLLFFSLPEAAAQLGGVSEQAWRRWEAGSRSIPADIVAMMARLLEWREKVIMTSADKIASSPENTRVILIWYASLADWVAAPQREPHMWRPQQSVCADLLGRFPATIRLVRFNPATYAAWLSGRPDSEALRAAWASTDER